MKDTFRSVVKRVVGQVPWLARVYRGVRDSLPDGYGTPEPTPLGFKFAGAESIRNGTFERLETQFLEEELTRCDVFVDIGANIGYFTCLARSHGVYTLAFEPLDANLRLAYRNIRANGWTDRLEILPVALAEAPGLLDLYGFSTGASLLPGWAGVSSQHRRTVPVSTLDTFLRGRYEGARIMIKIDVEGAELSVLRGAMDTLARRPSPRWLIEVCLTEHQHGINPHFMSVFDLFWRHGYRAETLDERRTIRAEDVSEWIAKGRRTFGSYNVLFLPQ